MHDGLHCVSDVAFVLVRLRLLVCHDYLHAAFLSWIAGPSALKVDLDAASDQFQMQKNIITQQNSSKSHRIRYCPRRRQPRRQPSRRRIPIDKML